MKRKIILTSALISTLVLMGCSGESSDQENINEQTHKNTQQQESNQDNGNQEEISIKIEDLSFEILEIKEPDSAGEVYMINQFTNNSEYPVTAIFKKAMFKDNEETAYIDNVDTVMPGETSTKFETNGPKSQDEEDIEPLSIDIRSQKEDGTDISIYYDYKLKTYEYEEYEKAP